MMTAAGHASKTFTRVCRSCGKPADMRWVYFEKGYDILRCPLCDFVTTDPVPTPAELEKFYSEHFLKADDDDEEFWRGPRQRVFRQIHSALTRAGLRPGGRVLDVGCAYGAFLQYMKEHGFPHAAGVDLSRPAVESVRAKLAIEAHHGSVADVKFPDGSFDAVTLIDTFEHLIDFKETLLEVRRILKPGGAAAVRVPNMNFHLPKVAVMKTLRLRWQYGAFTPPGHLNHFTPVGLRNLFAQSGFRVTATLNGAPAIYGSFARRAGLQSAAIGAGLAQIVTLGKWCCGPSLLMTAVRVE